jgi:hypothetical protein
MIRPARLAGLPDGLAEPQAPFGSGDVSPSCAPV